jgi:dipeptidyl aminopeptidase/acylaminoacyl peptidase
MTPQARRIGIALAALLSSAALFWRPVVAQVPAAPGALTLDQVLDYPFPANLVAAPTGSMLAWTFNERGARNIYVANGPDFQARRVTSYPLDEGQELTSLSFSPDARTIVYVRGGDHGANWAADGNLQPNPASGTAQPRVQVWSVATDGAEMPKLLGEGDEPAIAPTGDRVAFVKDRRIWVVPLDGSRAAEQLFFARGSSASPVWSADGGRLAFVSDRDDHSFIGIFTDAKQPIRYIAATTARDSRPLWSLDAGRELVFVRRPGRGGTPQSPLVQQPQPWSIMTAASAPPDPDAAGSAASASPAFHLWRSGGALVDSIPGAVNLHWAADDRVVFSSYQDGWPHLYSIQHPGTGGAPTLLTPGALAVEHVSLTPDGRFLIYSANTGADAHDIDRRHIFKVPVDGSTAPTPLTSGTGLEWSPVITGDGRTVAFLASTAQRPPLPAVMPIAGGQPRAIAAERLPSSFPSARLVTPEPITFTSGDGLQIHGQLFKTPGGDARRPALVYVHGGPQRQMLLGFHYMDYYANDYAANQYLASRGFIVLSINYRLGIGYGHAFHFPERAGARGASEYLDVVAAGKYLQSRSDVDAKRLGIWGGSYGGYLTALALGRNSEMFAAGVDIHGVHNWDRQGRPAPNLSAALAGDGLTQADLENIARTTYESSPVSAVGTWKSPVLLIHADDDRNVEFHQTVDLEQRLREKGVSVETLVIPDDIHDFLRWKSWKTVTTATGEFFERKFLPAAAGSQP